MWLLYDLIIHLYGDAISVASLFNRKAKMWVAGRRGIFKAIGTAVGGQRLAVGSQRSAVAWFHCASLGEFEQGRPVIEAFRKEHPEWKILLTFFSPSGYEIRKNYEGADFIFYLPLDTPGNARKFIRLVRPALAVFVKYEYWFRYLDELHKEKIPVYIISAIFRPGQHFFRWYGSWARKQLKKVTCFFVQDETSRELLKAVGIARVTVSGDTRFDRVSAIAGNARTFPQLEKFAGSQPVFLAGSTWPADEALITTLIQETGSRMKFIIAPHETDRIRVEALKEKVLSFEVSGLSEETVIFFSGLDESNADRARVVIVDGIGYLSHLYQYATIAYVGGGFGAGIHNILEAATFGKPVIFGPKYQKFREAVELIEAGGAFTIENQHQLHDIVFKLLNDVDFIQKSSKISTLFVIRKQGATEIILSKLSV